MRLILGRKLTICLNGGFPMDSRLVGLVGGIAGAVVGVMGGIVGTYFSIRNTNGPKERAFAIRAAALCWLGVSTFLACLFFVPRVWHPLLWIVYVPSLLWFIKWANRGQDRARVKDMP
jgi:hypothetical protein